MTDAEEGRFVASTIFEQKMQNQMTNSLLFYIVPMHNPALWRMLYKRDIPYRIYGGLSFIKGKK
jgi:DNA helicase-2/ATP-dependent DNA helicase PcrA